jgi:non-homologous end joining protein Ku
VALTERINAKRQGKTLGKKPSPSGKNVVDLMDALKRSLPPMPRKGRSPARPLQAKRRCS